MYINYTVKFWNMYTPVKTIITKIGNVAFTLKSFLVVLCNFLPRPQATTN